MKRFVNILTNYNRTLEILEVLLTTDSIIDYLRQMLEYDYALNKF